MGRREGIKKGGVGAEVKKKKKNLGYKVTLSICLFADKLDNSHNLSGSKEPLDGQFLLLSEGYKRHFSEGGWD